MNTLNEQELEKKTDIINILKHIDQIGLLKKAVLTSNQIFMLNNKDKKLIYNKYAVENHTNPWDLNNQIIEKEEIEIDTDNPIFVFCFMFMEYIKEINPELYDKAHKYAQDHTDIDITDFEIDEFEVINTKLLELYVKIELEVINRVLEEVTFPPLKESLAMSVFELKNPLTVALPEVKPPITVLSVEIGRAHV